MKLAIVAAAGAALFLPAISQATTTPHSAPAAGYYAGTSLVTINSGSCLFTSGTHIDSVFFFPGFNKNGAVERAPFQGNAGAPETVQVVFNSKTPIKGSDSWSGTATISAGPDFFFNPASGTFTTSELIYGTGFIIQTIQYNFNDGACVFTEQQTFIFTGDGTDTVGSVVSQQ